MKNRIKHLKVKIKSLAVEARIIRKEEGKTSGVERESLYGHRTGIVRSEARLSQIAYAFLRNRNYSQVESPNSESVDWKRVESLVKKFGVCWSMDNPYREFECQQLEQEKRFKEWAEAAKEYRNAKGKKTA